MFVLTFEFSMARRKVGKWIWISFSEPPGLRLLFKGAPSRILAKRDSSGNWQFKQPVEMGLPAVIPKVGCLGL